MYTPLVIYLQNRLICNRHCSTEYNKLLYVCGEEGYCELLVNFTSFLLILHVILLFHVHSRNERERLPDSEKDFGLDHDQAHKLVSGIIGGAKMKRIHLST